MTYPQKKSPANVASVERAVSLLLGGALLYSGLRKKGVSGWAIAATGAAFVHRGASGHCRVYKTLGIGTRDADLERGVEFQSAVTIQRSPDDIYQLLSYMDQLSSIFTHVKRIERQADGTYCWIFERGLLKLHYCAEVTAQEYGRRISWHSLPGEPLVAGGTLSLRKAPADRGTEVHFSVHYAPSRFKPLIIALRMARKVLQMQIARDLMRLKQRLETGELATGVMRRSELSHDEIKYLASDEFSKNSAPFSQTSRVFESTVNRLPFPTQESDEAHAEGFISSAHGVSQ